MSKSNYWLVKLGPNAIDSVYQATLEWETPTARCLSFFRNGRLEYERFSKSTNKPVEPTLLPKALCYRKAGL